MSEIKPWVVGLGTESTPRFLRDRVLLVTKHKANNTRVLWCRYEDMFKPIDEWQELIPERDSALVQLRATKSKIVVEYLVNAYSIGIVFDYDGNEVERLPLPECANLMGISSHREEEEFFYGVDSLTFPKKVYRYDPETSRYDEYRTVANPIDPDEFEAKQEWCVSSDGTRVPLFVLHKKGLSLDGTNPTILYGYGGFGINQTPSFMRSWVPWIKRGGVFAVACIRGGGEFGDVWHKGGIKEKKQRSFDDFIAAAEYLVSSKYSSSSHLGILGGSNGGLLVAAVAMQQPELFGAVCSRVPLIDMVRFHRFGMAMRWMHEYGDPNDAADLKNILAWSPYHNVREGIDYPHFLFMTAEHDTRVDPLHARKMTALLQNSATKRDVFLFTEMDAGHGTGRPITKIVEGQALVLSFFASRLGLDV